MKFSYIKAPPQSLVIFSGPKGRDEFYERGARARNFQQNSSHLFFFVCVLECTLFVNDDILIISHTFYCVDSFFSDPAIVSNVCRLMGRYPNVLQNLQRRNSSHTVSNIPQHYFFSCPNTVNSNKIRNREQHAENGLDIIIDSCRMKKNIFCILLIKGPQKDATSSTSSRK